ncbi:Flp pilus assembly protein CpaB [Dyella caseinilytica]|uniref:Flp pilus assembly protein CpaB n=1 Tax=Dyella caseinilytica TaxID=1849581 RepID=A0ABX7GY99_9GAMM|nr:Flp pilus assembly protein CpaB [Dyella caseinilytica]QRN55466.1 Flp pilus assembly protein CpaB [Dyella caseinilytica]GGA01924.1 membrane fimbriae assembly protein [Dyella caseinilytica]
MQKITRIAAILLVVLAFVLAVLALSLGRHNTQHTAIPSQVVGTTPASSGESNGVPVVVAADALPAGQAISFSSLRLTNEAQPPQGSFTNVDAVAGHLPLVGIPAGTPVTADLLAHGMAMQLIPGERALAVPVDEVAAVGNHIVPGDYVDVFLSLKSPQNTGPGPNRDQSQTRLLLSRLRVLAYGDRNLPVPAASVGKPATSTAEQSTVRNDVAEQARTAVLAVPLADIDELLLGAQNGKLTLALRYPGDDSQPDNRLFPQPPVVLAPLAYLSGEQHEQLNSPENDAFAGVDGSGLAGQIVALPRATTGRHVELASGIEIIRGAQRSDSTGTHSP